MEKEGIFKGRRFLGHVFGQIPTSMYKAANLNLTFDGSEEITGNPDKNGQFNGIIGLIQSNKSDFSVFSIPSESFDLLDSDMPIKLTRLTGEDEFFIMSHPSYNRTQIPYDIEDSIMEIKPSVQILFLVLFVVIHILIRKILPLIHSRINRDKGENVTRARLAWNMCRLVLNQGSSIEFRLLTQTWIFFSLECSVGVLICLYMNHMSSDLVTYTKPKLLKSLQDVFDARDEYKISFTQHASVEKRFEYSEDKLERALFETYRKSWAPLKGVSGKYYPTMGSDEFTDSPRIIKENKIAFMVHHIPAGIIVGFECKGMGRMTSDKDSTARVTKSSLFVSKKPFMIQHAVHGVNWFINHELERRLYKYGQRLFAHGIDNLVFKTGAEMTYNNLPIGEPVSIQCLNEKEWNDAEKVATAFGLSHCHRFLIHVTKALIPAFVSFAVEIVHFWFKNNWGVKKVSARVVIGETNLRTPVARPNKTMLGVTKRRMEAIERARQEIKSEKQRK